MTIVKKDSYRSKDRKINQINNKIKLVIDCDIMEWYRIKSLLNKHGFEIEEKRV